MTIYQEMTEFFFDTLTNLKASLLSTQTVMDIIYARKETVIVFNTVNRMMKTILLYIFLMCKSNEQAKKDSSVYQRSVLKMFKILF